MARAAIFAINAKLLGGGDRSSQSGDSGINVEAAVEAHELAMW
jgi:hypothetical protein